MSALQERLRAGGTVILDGGTGTELQRRGVPMDAEAWSGAAVLSHPDVVREVHEDFVRAGAHVILANTFATNRPLLARAGLADHFRELNLGAVDLALRAVDGAAGDRPVAVAGSINIWHAPPDDATARAQVREQAELLAEGGVDLIALEMMTSAGQTTLAVEAARTTGLPVWAGLSVRQDPDGAGIHLLGGEVLTDVAADLATLDAAAILVMHSLPDATAPALEILRGAWTGPLGAYAHMGQFTMPDWLWVNLLDPGAYAERAEAWVSLGARIVGGCCGTGPEYVAALAERFASRSHAG